MRTQFLLLALCLGLGDAPVRAADDSASPDTEIWRKVRADLFGKRIIEDDKAAGRIRVDIPSRAADAAVVPLAIRVGTLPGEARTTKVYLLIDRNPSPIAAIFEFGENSAGAFVESRVRIEEYTWVRVIAERADGGLIATQRFVKAAGGCSAPAGKALAERLAGMGQIKWRIDAVADSGPATVQLMVRHPNNSGLAMDQLSKSVPEPYFIKHLSVTYGDKEVMSAEIDASISENPVFYFYLNANKRAKLQAKIVDSKDLKFEKAIEIEPGKAIEVSGAS